MNVKSYRTIFIFETLILFVLILNSFNANILNMYKLPMFLLICDFIFFLILGYEKNNKRLTKYIAFDMFIYTFIFLILYYLFGIIIGYAKTSNYLTLYGITVFIFPNILTIIFKEHLRNSLLTKSNTNTFLIIYTTLLFVMIDVSAALCVANLKDLHGIFLFVALTLLPCASTNILATYLNLKVGYKPVIIYSLMTTLYQYILPVVPNPNKYLKSVIDLILPIVILLKSLKKINIYSSIEEEISRDYNKKYFFRLLGPLLLIIVLVYLVSGQFKYYAIAIVSGSMRPVFDRGSVVIVEQVNKKYNNYDKIKKGDIIAYKTNKNIIVHRIIRQLEENDEIFIYTKGDANNNEDNFIVKKENIIGIVRFKIPYIGYPTVWFSEL